MDITQAKINSLQNRLTQLYLMRYELELQLQDATSSTGNEVADKELMNSATVAGNTIAMVNRQIATREAEVARLSASVPASVPPTDIQNRPD